MTNEERDIISQFIARVSGGQAQSGFSAGSVPATQPAAAAPALPPVDPDADRFIAQNFQTYPDARYRITQLAFVQEHALAEAQNRIKRLEWEVQQAQQAVQQAQQAAQQQPAQGSPSGSSGGGFFGGLFGGASRPQGGGAPSGPAPGGPWGQQPQQGAPWGQQQVPQQGYYQPQSAPPPPQYPPNYQQGMFQRPGSGFLGSALTTAAGVAGGMVAGNALMSLFSPHAGYGGGFSGGGFAGGGSPWGAPEGGQGSVDTGAWGGGGMPAAGGQDVVDNGGWDQNTGGGDSAWTNNSDGGGDSSWDSGGSGGGSDDSL